MAPVILYLYVNYLVFMLVSVSPIRYGIQITIEKIQNFDF